MNSKDMTMFVVIFIGILFLTIAVITVPGIAILTAPELTISGKLMGICFLSVGGIILFFAPLILGKIKNRKEDKKDG